MAEVVQAVVEELRNWHNINTLVCAHYEFNSQSKRVIKKTGFTFWKSMDNKLYYEYTLKS